MLILGFPQYEAFVQTPRAEDWLNDAYDGLGFVPQRCHPGRLACRAAVGEGTAELWVAQTLVEGNASLGAQLSNKERSGSNFSHLFDVVYA
jgi:hypothetical protein